MASLIGDVLSETGRTADDIGAIGIGSPGSVDDFAGYGLFSRTICTGVMCPSAASFRKYYDKPVFVDNDANVAALAEMVAGRPGTDGIWCC